jgi:hypothetical protein
LSNGQFSFLWTGSQVIAMRIAHGQPHAYEAPALPIEPMGELIVLYADVITVDTTTDGMLLLLIDAP